MIEEHFSTSGRDGKSVDPPGGYPEFPSFLRSEDAALEWALREWVVHPKAPASLKRRFKQRAGEYIPLVREAYRAGKIAVWRQLLVQSPEDVDIDGLGLCWSFSPEGTDVYGARNARSPGGHLRVLVGAEVDPGKVAWGQSVALYATNPREREVRLYSLTPVVLTQMAVQLKGTARRSRSRARKAAHAWQRYDTIQWEWYSFPVPVFGNTGTGSHWWF